MTRARGLVGVALLALCPARAPAQPAAERLVVRVEPSTPVVAVTVLLGTGPLDEGPDRAGLAYLAGRSILAPLRPELDSLGGSVDVEIHPDAVEVTLVVAPDAWLDALQRTFVALFRDPPDSAVVERQRQAILAELRARATNPADAAERALDSLAYGPDHPWGRPAAGTPETMARLTVFDVDSLLRRAFVPERAVVAVVGPVDPAEARAAILPVLGDRAAPPPPVPPAAAPSRAKVDFDAITTWVLARYPLPPTASPRAAALLADLLHEDLAFGPRRPTVYDTDVRVRTWPGGGELRVLLVVPPQEADAWADRIVDALARYAATPLHPSVFADRLRHFRGRALLALRAPEDRSAALARARYEGRPDDPLSIDDPDLGPALLQATARALGEPTLVLLGPHTRPPTGAANP